MAASQGRPGPGGHFGAGYCAAYVRTVGKKGRGSLALRVAGMEKIVEFEVW
ncbi:MAG: hypothetical protein IJR40_01775 [Treponema sp.]|nr:hypothetical protein [Treponema sp.]MBQ7620097.1 hypothetical protein [Treponema sp.]MBQ9625882.1 hypothetical protein [Treponema sp.]